MKRRTKYDGKMDRKYSSATKEYSAKRRAERELQAQEIAQRERERILFELREAERRIELENPEIQAEMQMLRNNSEIIVHRVIELSRRGVLNANMNEYVTIMQIIENGITLNEFKSYLRSLLVETLSNDQKNQLISYIIQGNSILNCNII